jgi:hypothetical protein
MKEVKKQPKDAIYTADQKTRYRPWLDSYQQTEITYNFTFCPTPTLSTQALPERGLTPDGQDFCSVCYHRSYQNTCT